jgi:putative peptide maturation system protein
MNDALMQNAVRDTLEYLLGLQQEGVRPPQARASLQPLRGRHPGLQIDLLAEEDDYHQAVHYDALLRREGEGTVSLSWCPERATPWPLRGVHRWNEGDLVRVNANVLQVEAAIACLDFIWNEAPTIDRLVNLCLIREELDRRPILLSDRELQEAMDHFRAARKLFRTEDTLKWLNRHGMSHEKLERYVSESAMLPKLRERVAAGRVEDYFERHRKDFDVARIARFDVPDQGQARKLAGQIRAGELTFYAAAERLFEAADAASRPNLGLFAAIERRNADPPLLGRVFSAAPGEFVGPVATASGYALIRVLGVAGGQLDDRTRAAIQEILFNEWLEERREAAQIEWCWGNAVHTVPKQELPVSVAAS